MAVKLPQAAADDQLAQSFLAASMTTLPLSSREFHAWVGPAKPQPFSGGHRSVMLLGNYEQAYVPDLAPPGAMTSQAGMLAYFGSALA
jgi:hypothetical protein